jgi:hypothetical protein
MSTGHEDEAMGIGLEIGAASFFPNLFYDVG